MRVGAHKNNTHGTIKYILLIYYYNNILYTIIHSQYYITEKKCRLLYWVGLFSPGAVTRA